MLQEHRDETDAVKAESLTEVVAVIVSDVIDNSVTHYDCYHLHQ